MSRPTELRAYLHNYPGGPQEPDVAEAQEAVRMAGEIVQFVRDRLFPDASA